MKDWTAYICGWLSNGVLWQAYAGNEHVMGILMVGMVATGYLWLHFVIRGKS